MQQFTAPDGDGAAVIPVIQPCALSLKARETAALSLKRIFEQHVQRNTCSPAIATSTTPVDDNATLDMDLDLRLATPSSFCGISTESTRHEELPQLESLNLLQNTEMGDGAAPLTIFYNGSVYLFHAISAEKANAIFKWILAANSCSSGYGTFVEVAPACRSRSRTPTSSFDLTASGNPTKSRSRSQAELPFARKESVARVLTKRKDRVEAKVAEEDMRSKMGAEKPFDGPRKKICTEPQLLSDDLHIEDWL